MLLKSLLADRVDVKHYSRIVHSKSENLTRVNMQFIMYNIERFTIPHYRPESQGGLGELVNPGTVHVHVLCIPIHGYI